MSSAMMMERTGMGMPGLSLPGSTSGMTAPGSLPTGANFLMVPRCTLKLEKCQGGLKLTCVCDDKVSCSMVQNLCTMLAGGMCSCCCMLNGMVVNICNLTMGMCKCEMTESGCCITCTSGDPACCQMIQSCCDSIQCMLDCGCTCCVLMNNTPVCCGTCESKTGASKPAAKR